MKATVDIIKQSPPGVRDNPANFDRLAPLYRWMEALSFGPFLWWCRCAFLPDLTGCRYALVLGDGDGRFTAHLMHENPTLRVDAIDASPAMLRALARRSSEPSRQRLRTSCVDIRNWQPAADGYDLVVTHFFLDCLSTGEVAVLARKLRAAAPRAKWVVSEFAEPGNWFGRLVARPLVALLYWAFGWMTGLRVRQLPEHRQALHAAGFALVKQSAWLGGLLVGELWQAQQDQCAAAGACSTLQARPQP